jgi:hypothetical protein
MDDVQRARLRLAMVACGAILAAVAGLLAAHVSQDPDPEPRAAEPRVPARPHSLVSPKTDTVPAEPVPAVWSRPVTRAAPDFARAFALAIWSYDSGLSYESWSEAIGGWANPLGDPVSARVARSMLPPRPAYDGLRAQSAQAHANVTEVTVPDAAAGLVSRAPEGWHALVVRGTQHVSTAKGRYQAARQMSVAVVCNPTCWLWSATPEVAG